MDLGRFRDRSYIAGGIVTGRLSGSIAHLTKYLSLVWHWRGFGFELRNRAMCFFLPHKIEMAVNQKTVLLQIQA